MSSQLGGGQALHLQLTHLLVLLLLIFFLQAATAQGCQDAAS
jgi:hypothetical protein